MTSLLKSLALMLPALRRLYNERNHYANELVKLNQAMVTLDATKIQLLEDLERVQAEKNQLQQKISHLTRQVEDQSAAKLHVIGYARSGTTILMDILNSSRETLIKSRSLR